MLDVTDLFYLRVTKRSRVLECKLCRFNLFTTSDQHHYEHFKSRFIFNGLFDSILIRSQSFSTVLSKERMILVQTLEGTAKC